MRTFLMNFSPKKLRISTTVLFSEVTQLMGKWAYTVRILYSNPCVTNWAVRQQETTGWLKFKTYLGDSTDHVRNVRADGSDGSNFLLLAEPFVDLEFIFFDHLL